MASSNHHPTDTHGRTQRFVRNMTARKLLLPPLLPIGLLLLLCVWTFISEATGEVRMIDGRPDSAPVRAAAIFAIISPAIFVVFAFFNLIDATLDRRGAKAWLGTSGLVCGFGLILSFGLHAPKVDPSPAFAIAGGFGASMAVILPMALLRRFVIRNRARPPKKSVS